MVHRPDRLFDILDMLNAQLAPKRLQFVYPKREKEANMLLIEATKDGSTSGSVLPTTIVHNDDGSIHQKFKRFTMDHKAYVRGGVYVTALTIRAIQRMKRALTFIIVG